MGRREEKNVSLHERRSILAYHCRRLTTAVRFTVSHAGTRPKIPCRRARSRAPNQNARPRCPTWGLWLFYGISCVSHFGYCPSANIVTLKPPRSGRSSNAGEKIEKLVARTVGDINDLGVLKSRRRRWTVRRSQTTVAVTDRARPADATIRTRDLRKPVYFFLNLIFFTSTLSPVPRWIVSSPLKWGLWVNLSWTIKQIISSIFERLKFKLFLNYRRKSIRCKNRSRAL